MSEKSNPSFIKKIGIPILLGVVALLAFKFFMLNSWKLERAYKMAKSIIKAPAAINLTLYQNNKELYSKSFPANPKGNYYINNQFDLSPYIMGKSDLMLTLKVNNHSLVSQGLYRFKGYDIIEAGGNYYFFTKKESGIQELTSLKNKAETLIESLKKKNQTE